MIEIKAKWKQPRKFGYKEDFDTDVVILGFVYSTHLQKSVAICKYTGGLHPVLEEIPLEDLILVSE